MLRLRAWNGAYSNPSAVFARRAVSSIFGLVLWGVALFLGLSLATWNVADPSFTHATSAPVQNWMGTTGAAFADPIMQMFGLAAPLILVPFALWGTRLLAGRPLGFEPGRIGAGIGALVLAPALLNAFPTTGAWPLPMGLGGVVGEAWVSLVSSVVGLHSGVAQGFFGGVLGVIAGALVWHAISPVRVRAREPQLGYQIRRSTADDDYGLDETDAFEDDTPRWSAALGMILHHAGAVAARVRRLTGLGRAAPRPLPTPSRRPVPAAPERAAPPRAPRAAPSPAAPRAPAPQKLPPAPEDDDDLFAVEAAATTRAPARPQPKRPRPVPAAPAVARPRRALPQDEPVAADAAPQPNTAEDEEDDRHYVFHRPLRGPAARLQTAVAQAVADGRLDTDPEALDHEALDDEPQYGEPQYDDEPQYDEQEVYEDPADEAEPTHAEVDIPDSLTEAPTYGADSAEELPWDDADEPDTEWDETDEAPETDAEAASDADDWADDEPEQDDDFDPLADAGARYAEPAAHAPVSRPPAQPLVLPHKTAIPPGRRVVKEAQPSFLSSAEYEFPPLALLTAPPAGGHDDELTEDALEANARVLEGVLEDFGVRGSIIHVRPGPVVTLYELEPAPGIKSSRVIGLADDIARSMSAISARVAVIPGKNAIGIELPNHKRVTVFLRELLASKDFERTKAKLPMCLGKTIGGEAVIADLARMPHLLVAGTTGSGKSVSINTMILSLLYWHKPEHCRVILIDPKMLELSVYDGIPHLLTPVVTDPKKAVSALKWAVREMEDRYRKMAKLGVRNIDGYNTRLKEADRTGEPLSRLVQTGFDKRTGEAIFEEEILSLDPMPYIVVIVDEMADLMIVAGKEIEGTIQRLAQMARAAGIHIIMATQRPSVDVITGTIKANFPTRISFQVTSKIDSRTVLGEMGAEQLLGMGDMLYMAGGGRIQRVHGPFVSDEEVEDVVAHLRQQGAPEYLTEVLDEVDEDDAVESDASGLDAMSESDDLYDRAVALVLRDRKASTSYVQRRLSIGYNRAATLIERMENEGVVSPANNSGKREILVPAQDDAA